MQGHMAVSPRMGGMAIYMAQTIKEERVETGIPNSGRGDAVSRCG